MLVIAPGMDIPIYIIISSNPLYPVSYIITNLTTDLMHAMVQSPRTTHVFQEYTVMHSV